MNDRNTIVQFYNNLVLKQSFMGYSKSDVLDSYKKLDSLYSELIQSEKADSAEWIKTLTEKVRSLESRVNELDRQKKKLSEENGSLQNEVASLKQFAQERQTYRAKADMLSNAMLRFEQEKAEQMKQIESQRQSIINQANAEAKQICAKSQVDYRSKINGVSTELDALQHKKASIVEQMRQLERTISQQIKTFTADHPEEA